MLLLLFTSGMVLSQGTWESFAVPRPVSLRGVAAFSEAVCWVSGAEGRVFRTANAGKTWEDVSPVGYDSLDFRDIEVFNKETALIVSAGYPTRILKTNNGGTSWREVYTSDDHRIFLDAMDFWDDQSGVIFGDALGKDLLVLTTDDQGEHWNRVKPEILPDVAENQGGFAASGSCLQTIGDSGVIIGLGGPEATLLISRNRGFTWTRQTALLSAGTSSSGIFSFSFYDNQLGLMVGGDYTSDSASANSIAITRDGGYHWELITHPSANGYYHSACYILDPESMIGISRFGSSRSFDGGKTWQRAEQAYYSISGFDGGFWASGPGGKVGRWIRP